MRQPVYIRSDFDNVVVELTNAQGKRLVEFARQLEKQTELYCTDPDPKHVHDDDKCCECGSALHCCGGCPVFTPNDVNRPLEP